MFESLSDRLSGNFRGADQTRRPVGKRMFRLPCGKSAARSLRPMSRWRLSGSLPKRSGKRQSELKSSNPVTPGQVVVKIVHDELVAMLGSDAEPISLHAAPPVTLMMVGLQGSGKTTTTAKIAKRLTEKQKKKVLMASLDVKRPAAQEQLRQLGIQTGVETLPVIEGQSPVEIAGRAQQAAKLGGYDVVILDTAGRTHIDEPLMVEMADIKAAGNPHEILLVVDSLTGQDAVNLAQNFDSRVGITGIVLTRIDGDGRGGAALSMRAVTGKPIKLIGTGEKMEALEDFHPGRIADRILGMGDIVSLVEKASETIDQEKAAAMAKRMQKGEFTLDDLSDQLDQMKNLGGMGGIMSMMPGIGKMKKQIAQAGLDDSIFKRQQAIISSMTRKERKAPKVLNASRKKRVAAGSGTSVQEINQLLKMHRQMGDMMRKMGKGKGGMMGGLGSMMGGGMMNKLTAVAVECRVCRVGCPAGWAVQACPTCPKWIPRKLRPWPRRWA